MRGTTSTMIRMLIRAVGAQMRRYRAWFAESSYRPERHYMRGGRPRTSLTSPVQADLGEAATNS